MDENIESQKMELVALESIYEDKDFVLLKDTPPSGRFMINVRMPETFKVKANIRNNLGESEEVYQVKHLPPVTLFFSFPPSYPSDTCPSFLLSCNWLTSEQLSLLCQHLEYLWTSTGDAILFTWFQFLQDEVLDFLHLSDCLDVTELIKYKSSVKPEELKDLDFKGSITNSNNQSNSLNSNTNHNIQLSISGGNGKIDKRALNELSDGRILLQVIKEYNEFKIEEAFFQMSHVCEICFATKEGCHFVVLKLCKHFFCKECLKSYCEIQIIDGNVHSLNCPNSDCKFHVDCSTVRQVTSPEIFERYDSLLLASSLEGMTDISYCPRRDCQCPVLIEVGGRMGSCPACSFVFCPFCKTAYHGVAPCSFKSDLKESLFKKYMEGDSVVRANIERQYGKRVVKSFVEDVLSENWKENNSKPCPKCKSNIEKTIGCNKMTCFRCGKYFCWLCMSPLSSANPYDHFQDERSVCYGMLFPDDEIFELNIEAGDFLVF